MGLHPPAHADGLVEQVIQGALAFPHKMSAEALQRWLDAFLAHDTADRLSEITAPTLVLAGGLDRAAAPYLGRVVADGIPGARFEVLPEGHRPFVEAPEEFNSRVDAFWREVEKRS